MEPILQTKKLDLRYGAFQALYGIDTDIFPNEITALIGPNRYEVKGDTLTGC